MMIAKTFLSGQIAPRRTDKICKSSAKSEHKLNDLELTPSSGNQSVSDRQPSKKENKDIEFITSREELMNED